MRKNVPALHTRRNTPGSFRLFSIFHGHHLESGSPGTLALLPRSRVAPLTGMAAGTISAYNGMQQGTRVRGVLVNDASMLSH